jgi:hypothetical protein
MGDRARDPTGSESFRPPHDRIYAPHTLPFSRLWCDDWSIKGATPSGVEEYTAALPEEARGALETSQGDQGRCAERQ